MGEFSELNVRRLMSTAGAEMMMKVKTRTVMEARTCQICVTASYFLHYITSTTIFYIYTVLHYRYSFTVYRGSGTIIIRPVNVGLSVSLSFSSTITGFGVFFRIIIIINNSVYCPDDLRSCYLIEFLQSACAPTFKTCFQLKKKHANLVWKGFD